MATVHITTKTGREYDIVEDALDDYTLFKNLLSLNRDDYTVIPDIAVALLGEDGEAQLAAGRAKLSEVVAEISDIIGALSTKKK